MKRVVGIPAVLLLATLIAPAQQGLTLEVQIHYTGSGTVDDAHKAYVALWLTPDTNGQPAMIKSTTSKDGTVTFSDIPKSPVYVGAAFDPSGKWDAESGPPTSGTSLGMYSKDPPKPDPVDITPGKTAKVTLRFDDTVKTP